VTFEVLLEAKLVKVAFDPGLTELRAITEAIEGQGFDFESGA
jgi:hypothetical protein